MLAALFAGADSPWPTSVALAAIDEVIAEVRQWAPPDASATRIDDPSRSSPLLTRREMDVLKGLGRGLAPAAIAGELGISVETCRAYVKGLRTKLGARTQLEAVVIASRIGLIPARLAHRD